MADFTQIPNDLLEELVRTELSSYETRAMLFIARMTWGQCKESETLVLRQFSNATGIDRRNIHRALGKLESRRLIVVCRDDRKAATYRIHSQLPPPVTARQNHMKPNGPDERIQWGQSA
jgi:phage replication O-like protein O